MLSTRGRRPASVLVEPVARGLLRLGLTPNVVTVIGAVITCAIAVLLIPQGHLFTAAVASGLFAAFDLVDGTMARLRGGGTRFGATLDATCDRITDGALFAAITISHASAMFAPATTRVVVIRPSEGRSTNPHNQVPTTAPSVFTAYSVPTRSPAAPRRWVANRASSGSVPPIIAVGSSSATPTRPNWMSPNSSGPGSSARYAAWYTGVSAATIHGNSSAYAPMTISRTPYTASGRGSRSAYRPSTNPPAANPAMNDANTVLIANVLVPNTSCSSRTHSDWYTSAVPPDTKNNGNNAVTARS